jgi:hypothetical protein
LTIEAKQQRFPRFFFKHGMAVAPSEQITEHAGNEHKKKRNHWPLPSVGAVNMRASVILTLICRASSTALAGVNNAAKHKSGCDAS